MECKNPQCELHTEEVHNGCVKSGKNKCKDGLHLKTCWTKEDKEQMIKILSNYETD